MSEGRKAVHEVPRQSLLGGASGLGLELLAGNELEHIAVLEEAVDVLVVLVDLHLGGVEELHAAGHGEEVDGLEKLMANLDSEVLGDVRGERLDAVHAGHVADDARAVGDEEDLLAVVLGGDRVGRKDVEALLVDVRVNGGVDLVVAEGGGGDSGPGAVAAVAARPDLNEAGPGGGNDNLHVGGAVVDVQGVEDVVAVLDELELEVRGHRADLHAKVDVELAVGLALVVLPDGDDLVVAVARDRVNDVLAALEVLHDEHALVGFAARVDGAVDAVEGGLGLLHVGAEEDIVGAGALVRLDDDLEGGGVPVEDELLDVLPLGGEDLLGGADASGAHSLVLEPLVAAGDGEVEGVAAVELELLHEGVGDVDAALGAGDDALDLEVEGHDGGSGAGDVAAVDDLGVGKAVETVAPHAGGLLGL
mmetsp:Transcript_9323/g.26466  ORF Transcript_9323/g.26466 Transcript_9323/m.26466 type:complete len:420 (+) Transcript_9323:186-1445(+)